MMTGQIKKGEHYMKNWYSIKASGFIFVEIRKWRRLEDWLWQTGWFLIPKKIGQIKQCCLKVLKNNKKLHSGHRLRNSEIIMDIIK